VVSSKLSSSSDQVAALSYNQQVADVIKKQLEDHNEQILRLRQDDKAAAKKVQSHAPNVAVPTLGHYIISGDINDWIYHNSYTNPLDLNTLEKNNVFKLPIGFQKREIDV